ncbi:hypothetical protein PQX77_012347 [Marasmius sp. AFHP31]|nr:hypothetical protein PQX77_012347 [Marasmius sp. AFHP31]
MEGHLPEIFDGPVGSLFLVFFDENPSLKSSRRESNAHLLGLNRSKNPQLILLNELVPAAVFGRNIGKLEEYYLNSLRMHWSYSDRELWMDMTRGVICRGPVGPKPDLLGHSYKGIKDPVASADILKEDVLPTVFCTTTNAPIAVANNVWQSYHDNLVEQKLLGNERRRYRLDEDDEGELYLALNFGASEAWASQVLSILHTRGISLEKISRSRLLAPHAMLKGNLSYSGIARSLRLQQTVYLFVHLLPPDRLPDGGPTSSHHYWSFQRSGEPPLSREACHNLGLPIELEAGRKSFLPCYQPTDRYKLFHQYQLLRGFDPTTIGFSQHLGLDAHVFRSINDSCRFEVVDEGQHAGHNLNSDTVDPERKTTSQCLEGSDAISSPHSGNMHVSGVALVDAEVNFTTPDRVAGQCQRISVREGAIERHNIHAEQQNRRYNDDANSGHAVEASGTRPMRPLPKRSIFITQPSTLTLGYGLAPHGPDSQVLDTSGFPYANQQPGFLPDVLTNQASTAMPFDMCGFYRPTDGESCLHTRNIRSVYPETQHEIMDGSFGPTVEDAWGSEGSANFDNVYNLYSLPSPAPSA